jgi:hypothetical protein
LLAQAVERFAARLDPDSVEYLDKELFTYLTNSGRKTIVTWRKATGVQLIWATSHPPAVRRAVVQSDFGAIMKADLVEFFQSAT